MTATPIRQPQDRRPSLAKKQTRKTEATRDAELDRGISFIDDDGTRLSVRVRDVKGRHDAALVAATGMDFMGLLETLTKRQGLDLLAATVWFGRLVNDRDAGSYEDVLDSFDYEDVLALDLDDAKADDRPEA